MRFSDSRRTQVLLRLTLYSGEVYKAPRGCTAVWVRTGMAWVTRGGADIILEAGRGADLSPGRDFALVSALGPRALVVELLGYERSMPHRVSGTAVCHAREELTSTT
jgi:hypothetical protein